MESCSSGRVLSIQSHVVSGYVGNKAAVFPLQLLGFDVDPINSVHFSNHTGFPNGFEGDVLQGDQLRAIMKGLERNDLLSDVEHLLTGYIGSASFLSAVLDVLQILRNRPNGKRLRYVCDPVLGDVGSGFYVPQELVQLFRDKVIPEANVVTPNQFEAEQLTGMTLNSVDDVKVACKALHDIGPSLVVITSVLLKDDKDDTISVYASKRDEEKDTTELWCIQCPQLPGRYTGTGDLLSSLLLGHSAIENNIPKTLEVVMNTMSAVIKRTLELSPDIPLDSDHPRELRLIQCKAIIENPPIELKAQRIE
ncbi:Pyridoxal kinase [Seminavis robusta]|uniref:pyridoxal kinase n=1 Tax=Seminavis robusta TaxID=568900 RepID=A0A9N8EWB7_9STRA|nr:Pyridoxal kinase [Seminavis robusta]|eukprot:Sro1797_g298200.1 Pyridoxal kinase (308) ;mRNA; r:14750-15766